MVILIGGVSCTGKTALAQKLLELYKMPYLSIDHLKMGLFRGAADCAFTPEDNDEIIAEQLWPILKAIIMTNIENGQNIIVEGCYLLPNRIKEFDGYYTSHIISGYIGFSANYIEKNYASEIIAHCNEVEIRADGIGFSASQLISMNMEQKVLCAVNSAKYFEINEDYLAEIRVVYEWIDKEITKRKF
jgi:putative acetyltransferase